MQEWLALFPLQVVLLPEAELPLHIFEERYKAMTADALAGGRQVAMALLKSGWEKDYYHRPAIEPVVCVGTILSHERLPDGKYNFLLQGHTRAHVVGEIADKPYRVARVEPLQEIAESEANLADDRQRLRQLFRTALGATALGKQFRRLLEAEVPTPHVADLLAFNYLEDVALKQSLLADADVARRVRRAIAAAEEAHASLQLSYLRGATNPELN